jgi:hypothetical protein
MRKSNPLFVDTTRFNGDALFTQVELNNIPEYVGANVFIRVIDKSGTEQIVKLGRTSQTQCTGKVFLTYRQEISYSFFVSRGDEPLFKSQMKTAEASYLIQATWHPISLKPDFDRDAEEPVGESIIAQDAVEMITDEVF